MFGIDGILGIIFALLQNLFVSGFFSFISNLCGTAASTATAAAS